ncbi:hypothetical protein [Microbacterium sp. KHB019]|uniref:hypothetical protein n=1 Tax=Microbacterium sp. KHB019 TaxID=3129770 RepID=UPI00307AF3BC
MRGRRRVAALTALALAAGLTACAPAMPESVIPGTKVVVGWTGALTSTNAAASPTSGNTDIAALTRARFGDVIDGDFVADESFGTVTILEEEPFTVRYDLAEPAWSDSIPLDAADLLLGWAGAAGYFLPDEASVPDVPIPVADEFARSIDVTYAQPVSDWQSFVTVPVPAHVLGERALGIDDPMEAKQAVITAIRTGDDSALEKLRSAWNEGFEIGEGAVAGDLLLSSGPFVVAADGVDADGAVELVPNSEFRGAVTPQVARIELTPPGEDPLAAVGEQVDAVQVRPVAANRDAIRELERKDFTVQTTNDGTLWSMLLRPNGVFSDVRARTSFMHSAPARDLMDAGAGVWTTAYAPSTSMTAIPNSRAYDIVNEDSGFAQTLGATDADPVAERAAAGLPSGTRVCVLYDRGSEFARGAFSALRTAAGEAGWRVADCGSDDLQAALEKRDWDAVIMRVPIPQSPADIAAQWSTGGAASITGQTDPARDELIAQLAQTTDVYEAREIHAQIEATIVRAAVALPIAANPVVTITDRNLSGVSVRGGATAPLMSDAAQWAVVP